MSVFITPLLSWLQVYGYPVLWLVTFVAAFGAPLPITLLLLAAGAFSAQGDFSFTILALLAISAAVAGDCVGYCVGRLWGTQALDWLTGSRLGKRFVHPDAVDRSRSYFRRHGAWAILLTRVLLSALGSVTNLVAGTDLYPVGAFLFLDSVGEAVGSLTPLILGFVVGASWEAVGDILGAVSLLALGLICAVALGQRLLSRR